MQSIFGDNAADLRSERRSSINHTHIGTAIVRNSPKPAVNVERSEIFLRANRIYARAMNAPPGSRMVISG